MRFTNSSHNLSYLQDLLGNYNGFQHPFLAFSRGFFSFEEAASFPEGYRVAYSSLEKHESFDEIINEQNLIEPLKLKEIYRAIIDNEILNSADILWNLNSLIGSTYYKVLVGDVTFEEFSKGITTLVQAYKDDKYFKQFWSICLAKTVLDYNLDTGVGNLAIQIIENDRLMLNQVNSLMLSGDIENDHNLMIIVCAILSCGLEVPFDPEDLKYFNGLDKAMSQINHPSKLPVTDVIDLIDLYEWMRHYSKLLFSINSISFLSTKTALSVYDKKKFKNPNIISDALKVGNELIAKLFIRIDLLRDFYKAQMIGEYFYEGSPFVKVVDYFFNERFRLAKTDGEKNDLVKDINRFYKAFPDFKKADFLNKYYPREEAQVKETREVIEEPMGPVIKLGGEEVYVRSKDFREKLIEKVISDLGVNENDEIIKRLRRSSTWQKFLEPVIRLLIDANTNLEKVNTFIKANRNRMLAITEVDDKAKNTDRAIFAYLIDDGLGDNLGALVFVLEFTNDDNDIEILVRGKEDITFGAGKTVSDLEKSIDKEITEEKLNISEIPNNIIQFLTENELPDFSFDFENNKINEFAEFVAYQIVCILKKNPSFANPNEKELLEKFLKLCHSNSKLKDAILVYLEESINRGEIKFHLGYEKNPSTAVSKSPRLIARSIFKYLSRYERTAADKYEEAFRQEAQNIFELLGEPDKSTSWKDWVIRDQYRIHFCYVNNKIEMCITWAHK